MSHSLASKIGEALAAPIRRGRVRFRTKAVRDYVEKSQAISAAGLRTDPATLAAVEREMFGDNLAFRRYPRQHFASSCVCGACGGTTGSVQV
jgi:hypothetical protein